jgi:hypothetical protein
MSIQAKNVKIRIKGSSDAKIACQDSIYNDSVRVEDADINVDSGSKFEFATQSYQNENPDNNVSVPRLIYIIATLSLLLVVGGVVAIFYGSNSQTEIKFLEFHITTSNVGIACSGLGVIIMMLVTIVLKKK